MRFITTKLYRAFPELDSYTAAQCHRFLAAAHSHPFRKLFILARCILAALAVFVVFSLLAWAILGPAKLSAPLSSPATIAAITVMVLAIILAPVVAFITRDFLLRRRITYILRARGICMACRYSLIGLPVAPDLSVTCPECTTLCYVDASMGELTKGEDGTPRYTPNPANAPTVLFSPATKRKLKFVLYRILPALALIFIIFAAAYEVSIRRQAALANSLRPGQQGLTAYIESLQPPLKSGDPVTRINAWDLFEEARLTRAKADGDRPGHTPPIIGNMPIMAEFDLLYKTDRPDTTPEQAALNQAGRAEARLLFKHYQSRSVFAPFDAIADTPYCPRAIVMPAGGSAIDILLPSLGQSRAAARLCAARMHLASESGDSAELIRAFRTCLALGRMCYLQVTLIDHLVGIAINSLAYNRLNAYLDTNPQVSIETIDALLAALEEQKSIFPPSHPWAGVRLFTLDTLCWIFANPKNTRFGKFSLAMNASGAFTAFSGAPFGFIEGRVGSLTENIETLDALFAEVTSLASQPFFIRDKTRLHAINSSPSNNLAVLNVLQGAYGNVIASMDQAQLSRAGVITHLLMHRFRITSGNFPTSSAQLVAAYPALPLDPFSGKPLVIKTIDPTKDPGRRSFLLYSIGADGSDDGGIPAQAPLFNLWSALRFPRPLTPAGTPSPPSDFIINDPNSY